MQLLIVGSMVLVGLAAGAPGAEGIRNFLRVNEEVCTGGQPAAADLARLKGEGVRAVLNLRTPDEHEAAAEEAMVRELGMRYVNIPVVSAEPKSEQVTAFLQAVAAPENRPLFIHCGSANRVGAFWMIRRAVVDGWDVEKAEEEGRRIGLRSPNLVEFARAEIAARAARPAEASPTP